MKQVVHLSTVNMHNKTLYPRVPSNGLTKKGYEDNKIARVCFADSIGGALTAMAKYIPPGTRFYVHAPVGNPTIIPNSRVRNHVPDAHITGEVWVMEKVKIQLVNIIEIIGADPDKEYPYTYGPNGKYKASVYGYKYKEIGRNISSLRLMTK